MLCFTGQVRVKLLYSGVGAVSASDIDLASASGATILAFNVRQPAAAVEAEAKKLGVQICSQRIIYRLLEEVRSGCLCVALANVYVECDDVHHANCGHTMQIAGWTLTRSTHCKAGFVSGLLSAQVGDLMAGSAAQVDQEVALGEASVLQVCCAAFLGLIWLPTWIHPYQRRRRSIGAAYCLQRCTGVRRCSHHQLFGSNCRLIHLLCQHWQVFTLKGSKGEAGGAVAGCRVSEGALKSAMQFRVLRNGEVCGNRGGGWCHLKPGQHIFSVLNVAQGLPAVCHSAFAMHCAGKHACSISEACAPS